MKYIEYKENRQHGTPDFPYAYYHITPMHPRYNMVLHWHTQYEIIYVTRGQLNMMINGVEYAAKSGDALFVGSGLMHGGTPEDAEYECLVFDADEYLRRCIMLEEETAAIISNVFVPSPTVISGCPAVERIFSALRGRRKGYRLIVRGGILELFGEMAFSGGEGVPKGKRRLAALKNALGFIEKHYQEQISLDDIAGYGGMNKGYLCRVFREMTHKTPVEYLNYYRIECACEQIASTDYSFTEIAIGCGFCDPSYFIKVFKKYKGVTPSEYAKNR